MLYEELASGNRKSHVPFGMLSNESHKFIHSKYCPPNFVWKDPRNLTKKAIMQICDHIRTRQDKFGSMEGLRFHAYFDGDNIVQADYGINDADKRAAARLKKQQKARSAKRAAQRKGKQKATTTPSASNSQIDPALLNEEASNAHNTTPDNSGGFIGESDMQLLINNGYPSTLPANGPNDGLPQYYITSDGLSLLKRLTEDQGLEESDSLRMTTRSRVRRGN